MNCPVSWLDLELYVLDELPPAERRDVEHHLGRCGACREDLDTIRSDDRPLPELPTPLRPRRWWAVGSGLLAAAALLLVVGRPPSDTRRKGGEVALSLVVQRGAVVVEHPAFYLDGDVVQASLTCPETEEPRPWQLVVFEGSAPGVRLAGGETGCGNGIALPGAFEVTGASGIEVCVALEAPSEPWEVPSDLGAERACVQLDAREPGE